MGQSEQNRPISRMPAPRKDGRGLPYRAVVSGCLNGYRICVRGEGTIDEERGETTGQYEIEAVPPGVDPRLFVAVMVTGYPNASASADGVENPFKGVSYRYARELAFATGEHLDYSARIVRRKDRLESMFVVTGSAPHFCSDAVATIHEGWNATDIDSVRATFSVTWRHGEQTASMASARTTYVVPSVSLDLRIERSIDLNVEVRGARLLLKQVSRIVAQPVRAVE